MDVKNTHSVTKTEISVFGRQALDAERRRSPSLADKVLKTGTQIAGDVLSGENIRTAAKRRTKTAGRDLLQSLLATPSPPGKRLKRTAPKKRITRRTTTNRRQLSRRKKDVFS